MSKQITTKKLLDTAIKLLDDICTFRSQEAKEQDKKDIIQLDEIIKSMSNLTYTARTNVCVLSGISNRLGKVLIVSSDNKGTCLGWEAHVNNTYRANSEIGQKCCKKAIESYRAVVNLYDPETDTYENVTEQLKNSKTPIKF